MMQLALALDEIIDDSLKVNVVITNKDAKGAKLQIKLEESKTNMSINYPYKIKKNNGNANNCGDSVTGIRIYKNDGSVFDGCYNYDY